MGDVCMHMALRQMILTSEALSKEGDKRYRQEVENASRAFGLQVLGFRFGASGLDVSRFGFQGFVIHSKCFWSQSEMVL
jgi:hypothetical protein